MVWRDADLSTPDDAFAPSKSAAVIAHPSSFRGDRLVDRVRPNPHGVSAFRPSVGYGAASGSGAGTAHLTERRSEWDVLKENHRFIREDEAPADVSWEERLARAYESKLFKEFALIDLKHYKSKRFALRWRTAPEVVDGIGEDTCGALRCAHHLPQSSAARANSEESGSDGPGGGWSVDERERAGSRAGKALSLRSCELPFAYEEAGARREALVKVRLCERCERKLCYKPKVEGERENAEEDRRERRRERDDLERRRKHDREERDRRRERDLERDGRHSRDRRQGDPKGDSSRRGRDDQGTRAFGASVSDDGRAGRRNGHGEDDGQRQPNFHRPRIDRHRAKRDSRSASPA